MRSRTRHQVTVIAALVGLAMGIVPASAAPTRHHPPVPTLAWAACSEDFPGLECATADVPLDYDRPNGPTTEIALARMPATDKARRLGSVFVNPGGPGASGVDMVLFGFGDYLGQNLDGRFDVVGFDPRGVGRSDPLRCFDSEEDLNDFFTGLPAFPYRPA